MRLVCLLCAVAGLALGTLLAPAGSTPSTTFWTPCTMDIQAPGITHLGLDDYFTVGGDNAIGGGGAGVYYFFTPDISLLTGPVWFNDPGINGRMKWTTQLDINF